MGTYGHHMVAGTVLGGALPGLHRLLAPRDGYEVTQRPTLRDLGLQWVLALSILGSLLFHLALMVVDTWHAHLMLGPSFPPSRAPSGRPVAVSCSTCWSCHPDEKPSADGHPIQNGRSARGLLRRGLHTCG